MATEISALKDTNSGSLPTNDRAIGQLGWLAKITLSLVDSIRFKARPMTAADHKDFALNLSLWINVLILITKIFAFVVSGSLSVLAALVDSALDILSQVILYWAEGKRCV